MSDPALISPTTTPQQLIELASALGDFSDKLDDYIKASGNPFTPAMVQLRDMDTHIASDAVLIGQIGLSAMEDDVRAALGQLQIQINSAKSTLAQINNVKSALSVVAAVLSVAASLSTGNPLGAASSVIALVSTVSGALTAAKGAS